MARTDKHVAEKAKPAKPAFKAPAQELEEFKAKVLGMKYGQIIWLDLDGYAAWKVTEKLRAIVSDEESLTAYPQVIEKSFELWPQYARLLERVPDALKSYRERYDREHQASKVFDDDRRLRRVGAPPKHGLAREALELFQRQQRKNYPKIARELNRKHGTKNDPAPNTADSVRKLLKRHYPDKI